MINGIVSHYKIIDKIGSGGMGVVYKAEDTKLGRTVALKFLPPSFSSDKEAKARFIHEAKSASALDHPNICNIHEIDETNDGQLFISMAYYEGETLKDKIAKGPIGFDEATKITLQICEGLDKAHKNEVIHRDIKPANIFITKDGIVKILDFGLAKMTGRENLTAIGTVMGTVAYMSPEQTRGENVDHRTDIWSVGVILYEMISGDQPFKGDYEQAVIYSILNENPQPLSINQTHIPEKLETIIFKALAKKSTDRFNNCYELLKHLKSCLLSENQKREVEIRNEPNKIEQAEESIRQSHRKITWDKNSVKKRLKLSWRVIIALVILFLVSIYIFSPQLKNNKPHGKKIAVLPFINLSNDPEEEYFSDGIMEDILTELVKTSDLKVISRTTMMRYKNTTKTLAEISKELNTDVILEGSVRKDSDQLRIAVQLIDARNDENLWAETFDESFNQIFKIQHKIAQRVAVTLNSRLSPVDNERDGKKVVNTEAYRHLLEGRFFYSRGTKQDISKSIEKYQQALNLDSNDARIWSALATSYIRQADKGYTGISEGYTKARWAAEKALALDNGLAWGHTIMGIILAFYDWDIKGAYAEFQKAMTLEPGNVIVIANMANLSRALGNIDDAIILLNKVLDIEPTDVSAYSNLGFALLYANRLDEAVTVYKNAAELNTHYPGIHVCLGLIYSLQGKTTEAINAIKLEYDEGWRLWGLSIAYFKAGLLKEADDSLQELIIKYKDDSAFQIAEVYSVRGETSLCFKWLEKAYVARDPGLIVMKRDPFLKNIEKDTHYTNIIKKMNLEI